MSAYDNMGKKKVGRFDHDGPLIMMVPRPEEDFVPKVGNRSVSVNFLSVFDTLMFWSV